MAILLSTRTSLLNSQKSNDERKSSVVDFDLNANSLSVKVNFRDVSGT